MGMQARGGIPRAFNLSAPTGGLTWVLESLTTTLLFKTTTNPVRIYFTREDLEQDANFWPMATTDPSLEIDAEVRALFLRGVGGTAAVSVIATLRKG